LPGIRRLANMQLEPLTAHSAAAASRWWAPMGVVRPPKRPPISPDSTEPNRFSIRLAEKPCGFPAGYANPCSAPIS
jgi:hypothetical protein